MCRNVNMLMSCDTYHLDVVDISCFNHHFICHDVAARHISKVANGPKIVIEKSTLPVRTAHSMRKVLNCNDRGIKFEILSNPEFLAEGTHLMTHI